MVWSESVGQSILVPGDKDINNPTDKRDYISLGADLPSELATYLDAGILFRSGKYVAGADYMQVKYFGLGAKNTYFFQFVYVENYKNVVGDHRFINLTSYLFDNDYSLITTLGPFDQATGAAITANTRVYNGPIKTGPNNIYTVGFAAAISNIDAANFEPANAKLLADGTVRLAGIVKCAGGIGTTGGVDLLTVPVAIRPATAIAAPLQLAGGSILGQAILNTDGRLTINRITSTYPAGESIAFNFVYEPGTILS